MKMDLHSCDADGEKSDSIEEVNPDNFHKSDPSQEGGAWKHTTKDGEMKGINDAEQPKVWHFHCTYLHKNCW